VGSFGQGDSFGVGNQSAGILQVLWVGDKGHHLLFGLYIFRYDAFNLFRLWGQVAAGYFRAGAFFGELLCVIILVFFLAN